MDSFYSGAVKPVSDPPPPYEPNLPTNQNPDPSNVQQHQQSQAPPNQRPNASDKTFCSVMAEMLVPLLLATFGSILLSVPYLVVAAVKGNGTTFCNGYWQNPGTTIMSAEIGGRVRPISLTRVSGSDRMTDRASSPSYRCGAS
jgi:hypothetical protein